MNNLLRIKRKWKEEEEKEINRRESFIILQLGIYSKHLCRNINAIVFKRV